MTLPVPVILKRLATDFLVLIPLGRRIRLIFFSGPRPFFLEPLWFQLFTHRKTRKRIVRSRNPDLDRLCFDLLILREVHGEHAVLEVGADSGGTGIGRE